MISIKLSNFRSCAQASIELPEKGLVRLDGPSGVGKSTTLLALKYAIYGDERGVKPWGNKSATPRVEVNNFSGLDIVRTNTPNTLTVSWKGEVYLDDAAQGVINDVLGMNVDEFEVSSFTKQDGENSILTLDPAGKVKIIQNLISKDVDIDSFKILIKDKLKEATAVMNTAKGRFESETEVYNREEAALLAMKMVDKPGGSIELGEYSSSELASEIKAYREEYDANMNSSLSYRNFLDRIKQVEKSLESKELAKKDILDSSTVQPWAETSKADIDKKRELFISKANFIKKFNDIVVLAQGVHNKFPEAVNHNGKLTAYIDIKTAELGKVLAELNQDLIDKNNTRNDLENWDKNTLDCPKCSAVLKMSEKKLVLATERPVDYEKLVNDLKEAVSEIMKEQKKVGEDLSFLDYTLKRANEIKASLGKDPAPQYKTTAELDADVDKMNEYIKSQNEIEKIYNEKTSTLNVLNKDIDQLKSQLESLNKDVASSTDPDKDCQYLKDLIIEKTALLDRVTVFERETREYEWHLSRFNEASEKFKETKARMEEITKSFTEASNAVAGLDRIKEKTNFAAAAAIDGKIDEMNIAAMEHIDRMFEDDGTVINLSSTTMTGKGEERAKISTNIFHKGEKVSKFSELSGGEKARGALAYQIGLSDLYSSPIFMVDEGLKGNTDDMKEVCIEILKEVAESKLVLVVEHGVNDSLFDKVVKI